MPNLTVSSDVDTFMGSADKAAMRTNLAPFTGLTDLGISMAANSAMTGFALGTISDTTSRPFNISQTWNNASLTGGVLDVAATVTAAGASSYIQRWLGGAAGATTRMILRNDGLLCFNALATGGAMAIKPVTGNAQLFFLRMDSSGAGDGSGAGGIYQESGYGVNGFTVAANYGYGFAANNAGAAFVTAAANDTYITRRAAGSLIFGKLESTTPVPQFLSAHDVTTGTGSALTLSGGRGSVAGGALNLGTSATNGAPVTHLSIAASGVIDFASAALTTETVVSNRTLTVKVGGATVKICCFV